jgi:hypothetical protein
VDEAEDLPEEVGEAWRAAVGGSEWGERVVEALREQMRDPERLLEPAVLVDAWTEDDHDGVPVLRAVYDHPFWPQRTGLRVRLDEPPFDAPRPGQELAAWLAANIADEIAEPLGRMYDLLVPDAAGVYWWGDGYRHISEHPDFEGDFDGWMRRRDLGWEGA